MMIDYQLKILMNYLLQHYISNLFCYICYLWISLLKKKKIKSEKNIIWWIPFWWRIDIIILQICRINYNNKIIIDCQLKILIDHLVQQLISN